MKKQNENGRIPEDRLSRANKRKKNNTIASILVMTGCLLVLVLVTYVAGILYSWIDSKFQNNANDLAAAAEAGSQTEESTQEVVKTYTQEEVDALIAEAKQQAEDEEENKILSGIRDGLTSGTTMVETLRPYYPNELVVVSNGTFNFVPIRDDLQKNDYVLENLNILEDGEVQYMQDGQVVSHKGIDVSKHQGNIDWAKSAVQIERLVRGLNSWPSAYTHRDGKVMKIWKALAKPQEECAEQTELGSEEHTAQKTGKNAMPGTVVSVAKDSFCIQTGDGVLRILEVQMPGKKRMDTGSFLRGYKVEEGMVFGRE